MRVPHGDPPPPGIPGPSTSAIRGIRLTERDLADAIHGYEAVAGVTTFFGEYEDAMARSKGGVLPRMNVWDGPQLLRKKEVEFCRVLAWFLDPQSEHDVGDHFLVNFVKEFVPALHRQHRRIRGAAVVRERSRGNCRIDLEISLAGAALICIEAKVTAPADLEQLQRYRQLFPHRRFHGLFLTQRDDKIGDDALRTAGFQRLTWSKVGQWLEEESQHLRGEHLTLTSRSLAGYLAGNFAESIRKLDHPRTRG